MLAAHEEIRGAVEYHHSEGLVESRDRRMLGGVLDLAGHGRLRDHGPPQVDRHARRRPAAARAGRRGAGGAATPACRSIAASRRTSSACCTPRTCCAPWPRPRAAIDALDIAAIAREPWFIPDTTNLKDQLNAFLKRRTHFALVVDEYGALQGLVTLEDILEEIVGEIEDEHDAAIEGVRRQPDGSVDRRRRRDRARPQPRAWTGTCPTSTR